MVVTVLRLGGKRGDGTPPNENSQNHPLLNGHRPFPCHIFINECDNITTTTLTTLKVLAPFQHLGAVGEAHVQMDTTCFSFL